MRETDIAIIGGGLAGSLAATMLGRRGYDVALIDPNEQYRPDFRCEKLEEHHVEALRMTGLADEILPAARHYMGVWVARLGRLCEEKPAEEYGIDYSALVNAVRALVPRDVAFVRDTVRDIALTDERQTLTLASGNIVSARLVIAANGLNAAVLGKLGMPREEISRCHSVSLGFDVEPVGSANFPFDALTYFGETPQDCVSYLTLFPIASGARANLFVYRGLDDPWLRQFRDDPAATLMQCLPRLQRLTSEFKAASPVKMRPTDLYRTMNVLQSGIVLIGDAYATACPTSGTGASKAMTDVARLCDVYVPSWLATPGMSAGKIAAFYDDPVKAATDAHSMETSLFAKRVALQPGLHWSAYRLARFMGSASRGKLRGSLTPSAKTLRAG
ncbi:MAG: FAD-dependent monooxygenase [Pseudolabrys sp.]|nr:FAD-dependent monooxygenase [Pseudolabrys sp.]